PDDEELGHVPDVGVAGEPAAPADDRESGEPPVDAQEVSGLAAAPAVLPEVGVVAPALVELGAGDGAEIMGIELAEAAEDGEVVRPRLGDVDGHEVRTGTRAWTWARRRFDIIIIFDMLGA